MPSLFSIPTSLLFSKSQSNQLTNTEDCVSASSTVERKKHSGERECAAWGVREAQDGAADTDQHVITSTTSPNLHGRDFCTLLKACDSSGSSP